MDLKHIWQARLSKAHLVLSLVLTIVGACVVAIIAMLGASMLPVDFSPWMAVVFLLVVYTIVALSVLHAIRRDAKNDPGAAKSNVIALGVITLPFLLLIGLFTLSGIIEFLHPSPQEKFHQRLQYIVDHQAEYQDSTSLVNAVLAALGADTRWRPYANNDWNFEVDLPDLDLEVSVDNLKVGLQPLTFHRVFVNTSNSLNSNLEYSVGYCRLDWISTDGQVDSLFDAQRHFYLEAGPAKLLDQTELNSMAHRGREMTVSVINTDPVQIVRCRMFFHHGVFYRLTVLTEEARISNEAMEHFFTSFRIGNGSETL